MELTSGPPAPIFGQHGASPPAYEESSHPVGPPRQQGGHPTPAYGQPGGPDITLSMVEAMRQHRQEG